MNVDSGTQAYFDSIDTEVKRAYVLATKARQQGKDPETRVDIPVAEDLAARVEGLVSTMFPDLLGSGLKESIRTYEKKFGKNSEQVALLIGQEVSLGKFMLFDDIERAAECGLRVAVAYLTLGIVTAPLEGISQVRIKKNSDGTNYLAVYYAGPIRSAGGTASAISVLAADFIRKTLGIGAYQPTEVEINRYVTEVEDYFTRVTPKQYHPTPEEMRFIITNIPVEITGDPTEELEVSNYKDLERIETNKIRGGMCLVLLDGLPLKAEKVLKRVRSYPEEYNLKNWLWLDPFIELKHKIHAAVKIEGEEHARYTPSAKYIANVLGGRPIISYPATAGGFMLRYGRSRTGGLASTAVHPATMHLTEFMAIGTQLAIEAPGKATVCTPCDSIEGPVVLLNDGSVVDLETKEEVQQVKSKVRKILSLGDLLIPYGEFVSNGHVLLPAKYCEEWWVQEVAESAKTNASTVPFDAYITNPFTNTPSLADALTIAKELHVPLHPKYTFFWHDLSLEELKNLVDYGAQAETIGDQIIFPLEAKSILETLCVPHHIADGKIILEGNKGLALYHSLGKPTSHNRIALLSRLDPTQSLVQNVSVLAGVTIMPKAATRLGMKMGRPEKAERRLLKGRPQVLFPCGDEGGRMRNLMETYSKGTLQTNTTVFFCRNCYKEGPFPTCPYCHSMTEKRLYCKVCSKQTDQKIHCKLPTVPYKKWALNVRELLDIAFKNTHIHQKPDLFKGVRGVSGKERTIEALEKGLLRTKYDLYVNKDGTTRYDMSDVTLTHFTPKEANVSVDLLKKIGYTHDMSGNELQTRDQVLELKPQDILISDNADFSAVNYMINICKFVDDLLITYYGLEPFYNVKAREDLIGQLVIGLAPHTSSGIIGRIVGFTPAKVCFATHFWHAGKRRNCDGDEDSILLLMDALLNFSRQFLPDTRGGRTMDAPLVLTTMLDPEEVDDESWNVDVQGSYSLAFYKATHEYKMIHELQEKPKLVSKLINTPEVFHIKYTHPTSDINDGPYKTKYVELHSMQEKVFAQLGLAEKIRAVDENKVAEEVITKHFLRDIRGNLRKFSYQGFRCINCNEKYRRPPLTGRCLKCKNGKLVLTVSEGAVRKYLEPTKHLVEKYKVSSYLRQQIQILERAVDAVFGKKDRQLNLGRFQ